MPCDINVTYTSLKSAFNKLQFHCWQYGSIFIRLAVIASETREMSWNSKWIWPYRSSRSSKVIDLGVNGKPICGLVINCNFRCICYRFRDIQASLTHSLTSRPSSMTVGDSRWPLYCLSSPMIPVLWHLLQLNVATATPLFYIVHPLSFGSSLVR